VRALGALLNNPWEDVRIEGVETTVKVTFEREVFDDEAARKLLDLEVDAGEPVRVSSSSMPFKGKPRRRSRGPDPRRARRQEVDIEIAPGYEIERPRPRPRAWPISSRAQRPDLRSGESLVATIRLKGQGGASFRGNVATRPARRRARQLKTSATSIGPEHFARAADQPPDEALHRRPRLASA
jgi:hypothetical protein